MLLRSLAERVQVELAALAIGDATTTGVTLVEAAEDLAVAVELAERLEVAHPIGEGAA
jgi:hypothetical protein